LLKGELVPTAFLLVGAVVFDFAARLAEIALTVGMSLLGIKNLGWFDLLAEIASPSVLLVMRCS